LKSSVASLRELTLPFGATSGARIELDGITGEIRVYDADNNLLIQIDGTDGFQVFDTNDNLRASLGTIFGEGYSTLILSTGAVDETQTGYVSLSDTAIRNRLIVRAGERADNGAMELGIYSSDNDPESLPSTIAAVCSRASTVFRPIIDFTGPGATSEIQRPKTVVNDLWYGTPTATPGAPTEVQAAPRGMRPTWLATRNTDVALSATVGTWTDCINLTDVEVLAGHRYEVICSGWNDFATGGAGFTVGEVFQFELQKAVGAGGYAALTYPGFFQVRTNIAAVIRHAMFPVIGYYEPAANATVHFKMRGVKSSGAAGVTATVATAAGTYPGVLTVKDVGTS
jgi:hypothetical protein